MRKALKVILLFICAISFLVVVLIPPFYSYPKSADLEIRRARLFQYGEYNHFLRRDWAFIFSEARVPGCRPVDWGMLALELVGVFGLWFGTWLLLKEVDRRKRQGNPP